MRAIVVEQLTEPDDLEVKEVPEPKAMPGGLVVEVRAAACNFFDILMVKGQYQVQPPFPFTPGAEIGGVVKEVGEGVSGFAVGDRVFASSGIGAFAEYSAVPAATTARIPDAMSFEEGAALPIIYSTSYCALVDRARLTPGEDLRRPARSRCCRWGRDRGRPDRQGARRARHRDGRRRGQARCCTPQRCR